MGSGRHGRPVRAIATFSSSSGHRRKAGGCCVLWQVPVQDLRRAQPAVCRIYAQRPQADHVRPYADVITMLRASSSAVPGGGRSWLGMQRLSMPARPDLWRSQPTLRPAARGFAGGWPGLAANGPESKSMDSPLLSPSQRWREYNDTAGPGWRST